MLKTFARSLTSILAFLFIQKGVFAQAPAITYPPPGAYTVNKAIPTLKPTQGGGAVPAANAGTITWFATFRGLGPNPHPTELPAGMIFDDNQNLFVCDRGSNVIRKVTPNGDISIFAGSGRRVNEDGTGVNASFLGLTTIARNSKGTFFLPDPLSHIIRQCTPNAEVSFFAGSGEDKLQDGKGVLASFGNVFDIVVDKDDNLFVTDGTNHAIRKITPDGTVSTFVGGNGPGVADGKGTVVKFDRPGKLSFDGNGNLYTVDYSIDYTRLAATSILRKITPDGTVSTIGIAGQPGPLKNIPLIQDIYFDKANNLYISSALTYKVFKLNPNGFLSLFIGTDNIAPGQGPLKTTSIGIPADIEISTDGTIYLADDEFGIVDKISLYGYAIDKPLPPGLNFDITTGIITGTPATSWPPTIYTVTASNQDGKSTAKITIEVRDVTPPARNPPKILYPPSLTFTVNETINTVLPNSAGGGPVPPGGVGTPTNFAGSGVSGSNDGHADAASFDGVYGISADAAGYMYVSDFFTHIIRKVSPNADVVTIAGNRSAGYKDANGLNAQFANPSATAVDAAGNIYVAESYNNRIRKISPAGDVITLAGTGEYASKDGGPGVAAFKSPQGLTVDAQGNVYVAETEGHRIRKIDPAGNVITFAGTGDKGFLNGDATKAMFNAPMAIAIDVYGNVFVTDYFNNQIRKITKAGTVTTYAGNGDFADVDGIGGSASFKAPIGFCIDNAGNLYVGELFGAIRKITLDQNVTTIAQTTGAHHITLGVDGQLFVAGTKWVIKVGLFGYSIDKPLPSGLQFNTSTGAITGRPIAAMPQTSYTVTATNKDGSSSNTFTIKINSGAPPAANPPVISYKTPLIFAINMPIQPLVPQSTAGAVDPNGYTLEPPLPLPAGLTLDPTTGIISGTPTAASPATIYKVKAVNSAGYSLANINIKVTDEVITAPPAPVISYDSPKIIYLNDPAPTSLLPNNTGGEVKRYSYALMKNFAGIGKASYNDGPRTTASFSVPLRVAIDAVGNMYVCDYNNFAIRKITPGGTVSTLTGAFGQGHANGPPGTAQFQGPNGIVVDSKGNLFVADQFSIRKVTADGTVSTFAGGITAGFADGPAGTARFDGAVSLAIDNNDNLYVADENNLLIRKITPAGDVSTLAGSRVRGTQGGQGTAASFSGPKDIVFYKDALYVADYTTVRKISLTGLVTTIAGNGSTTVKNGPALSASFGNANAIAINAAGDIYIMDIGNDVQNETNTVLRRIDKDNIISNVAVVDETGNQVYLSGQNSLLFDKNGVLYTAGINHYIQTFSFDRYTIDKPLPDGLTFNIGTGEISGKPLKETPATDYTITAYNAGGNNTTTLNLRVKLSEVKQPSVITFPNPPVPVTWNDLLTYDPSITSTQQQTPIVLTSSNENVVRINTDGKTLIIVGVGTATIKATQEGNDSYLPADNVSKNVIVEKADPMMALNAFAAKSLCSEDFVLTSPTRNHSVAIVYVSSNPAVATVEQNGMIHILSAGTTVISANQAATALYNQAAEQRQTLTIGPANPVPGPAVKISVPSVIYEGINATFTASVSGSVKSYEWFVNNSTVSNNKSDYTTNTLINQDRLKCVVTFTDKCLVPSTDEVTVTVLPAPVSITPPNAFTPNGDGTNDVWRIPALVSYPNCSVSVFNRNGTQLLSSTGYNKPWDGTYKGKDLPAGTYYYIIDPRNGDSKVSGHVTIIR